MQNVTEEQLAEQLRDCSLDTAKKLFERKLSVEDRLGYWEETPLLIAARAGRLDLIKHIHELGADILFKSNAGDNALLIAAA